MESKVCSNCNTEKLMVEFQSNQRYADGFSTWCKTCHKNASAKSRKKLSEDNPNYHKNNALKHKHGITLEKFQEKQAEQGGHCALCSATSSSNGDRLGVDHDHKICPGKYACDKCRRGLLCSSCNARLGYLEGFLEEAFVFPFLGRGEWIKKAIAYINHYSASPVTTTTITENLTSLYLASTYYGTISTPTFKSEAIGKVRCGMHGPRCLDANCHHFLKYHDPKSEFYLGEQCVNCCFSDVANGTSYGSIASTAGTPCS